MTNRLVTLLGVAAALLLPCAVEAQTPSQLPGQTVPVSPVQEIITSSPKPWSNGETRQFYEIKVNVDNTRIRPNPRTTPGEPLSFLTPGNNVTADFTIFQDRNFGTNHLQFLSIVRSNNDPRVDPEQNSLQRGYLKLTTPNWEWTLGDALIGYSRLTYNQNVRGLSVARRFGTHFRLLANASQFTDRWGSIWKDSLLGKPYNRVIAGARAEFILSKDKVIGLNFSHGRDMENSIRPDLQEFGLIPLKNEIGSIDARLTFHRIFSVDGELAYSATNMDQRIFRDYRKDYGGRLDTNLRYGRLYVRSNYVRLMPSFLALNARQLADLQDVMVRGGLNITENVTVEGTYRRTNNNLRGQRPEGTTVFTMPEARVSFRRLPGLGKTIVNIGYRDRRQRGPIRQTEPMEGVAEKRNVPVPFVEVSVPFGSTLISVSWERRLNNNSVLPAEKTSANSLSGSLRSNLGFAGWNFAPMGRYELETEDFPAVYGTNTNRSVLASGLLDAPKYFSFDVTYRVLGASLFAECTQVVDGPPCNPLLPGVPGTTMLMASGYRRPAFHAAVTFKLRNSEDRFLVFSFDRNTNLYALPDRDFRERIVAVTFVYRLRR